MPTIEFLAERWIEAKEAEREAVAYRVSIEDQILEIEPAKEEGSTTLTLANGLKLKATGKLIYKVDIDMLEKITEGWNIPKPLKYKIEADETALKTMRADRPDLWRTIAPAVTVKAAKTNITIEGVKA